MTSFQFAALFITVTTIALAWCRGGHPERLGAAAILIWVATSVTTPDWLHDIVLGNVSVFEAALELVLLAVFLRMAMKGQRWWPFAATAVMTLSVMVYLAQFLVAGLDRRAEISAHVGLTIALNLTLLAGVFERWLAGEPPASETAVWNRSRPAP
jgi:hypothetical protein